MQHIATAGSYTRTYAIATDSNQLLSTTVGAVTYTYPHDTRGNMSAMPHLNAMHWNLNNELRKIENGIMQAYYQYSSGQRIRKYVAKGNITEERIYLGSFEIYRRFENSSLIIERQTVHVSDDTGRIAMLETRTVGDAKDDHDTAEELTRYIYSNHLQSASLELDESGAIISYEEYHPYGTTSYQAMNVSIHAVAKRYRYTGKERDEESGLYYHGARYYIPWLCRWSAVDPLETEYSPWSPYHYLKCNPIMDTDSTGMGGDKDPPKGYYKVGSMWDSFDEEGNNKYGLLGGWVDLKGTGDYKYYTNEEYLHEFGGNKKFRPTFSGTVNIAGESPGINNGRILHHDGTIEKTRTYGSTSVPSKEIKQKSTITTIQEESETIENIELTKIPIDEKQDTLQQEAWLGAASKWVGGITTMASGIEHLSGPTKLGWIGGKLNIYGSFSYEPFRMGTRQFRSSTFSIAKGGKILGEMTFTLNFLLDTYGVINYYQKGASDSNAVHPAKAIVNTSIGAWGMLNPATAIGSAVYYGIDAFYPGGWMGDGTHPGAIMDQSKRTDGVREIIPNFNMHRDIPGGW